MENLVVAVEEWEHRVINLVRLGSSVVVEPASVARDRVRPHQSGAGFLDCSMDKLNFIHLVEFLR